MTEQISSDAGGYDYEFIDALLSAVNEAPPSDHGKILRSYLLDAIDKMQQHSVFQLDLLEKVALIALNNVQDVRLYSLEARVKEIAEGQPLTAGDIIGELFFAIAIEAALVAGIAYIGPAVAPTLAFLLVGAKSTTRSPGALRRSLTSNAKMDLEIRLSNLASEEGRILERLFNKPPSRNKRRRRQHRKDRKVLRGELHAIQDEINYVNINRDYVVEREVSAMPVMLLEDLELHKNLQILKGYRDHYVDAGKSVARSIASTSRQQHPAAFIEVDGTQETLAGEGDGTVDSFTTTRSIMQVVSQCETLKLDLIHHYSTMRSMLKFQEDDDVLEALETVLVLSEVEANMLDLVDTSESIAADIESYTIPMELAIWLTYLESNNVLEREEVSSSKFRTDRCLPDTTRFIGNDFIEHITETSEFFSDSPRTSYKGRTYAGLHVLDEHQSYYLFHKFVKNAFDQFASKVPKSKNDVLADFIHQDVANDAFRDVLAMEKSFFWSGDNDERQNLIKEMGVVVIEYFIHLRNHVAKGNTLGFSDEIPEGTAISALLGGIEKTSHTEPVPSDQSESLSPVEFEEQIFDAWEDRVLLKLTELGVNYDQALEQYNLFNEIYRQTYQDTQDSQTYDDLFVTPRKVDLLFARSSIEGYSGALQNDEDKPVSEAIATRITELNQKVMSCPVEKEMFSTFPQ